MPDGSPSVAPERRAPKPDFLTQTRFDEFDLPARVLSNLNDAGFVHCTPIQEQSLPVSLAGHDVAGQAQTGTGKTAAFLVTMITRFLSQPDMPRDLPSALIIAPTRELYIRFMRRPRFFSGIPILDSWKSSVVLIISARPMPCDGALILSFAPRAGLSTITSRGFLKPKEFRFWSSMKPTGSLISDLRAICAICCASCPLMKKGNPCFFPPHFPTGCWNSPMNT